MTHVDRRGLGQQPPLRLELYTAHKQVPAVANIGAKRPLNDNGDPQPKDDRQNGLEGGRMLIRLGDHIDEPRT